MQNVYFFKKKYASATSVESLNVLVKILTLSKYSVLKKSLQNCIITTSVEKKTQHKKYKAQFSEYSHFFEKLLTNFNIYETEERWRSSL